MYIYNIFPQFRSMAGGERLILKLCDECIKMGHTIGLITLSMDKSCFQQLNNKIKFKEICPWMNNIKNHYIKIFLEHLFVYKITKLIPDEADIICFHRSSSLPALYYHKKIIGNKKPLIYYCYEPPRFVYDLQKDILSRLGIIGILIGFLVPFIRFVDKKTVQSADRILVFNNYMREWIRSLYQKDAVVVGPLAVDTKNFSIPDNLESFRGKWGISNKDNLILTINKLHRRKRIHLLIRAMQRIIIQLPNTKLFIVGTGPEEKKLKHLTNKLKLNEKIIFTGHLPESDIPVCYSVSDVYVNLAKNEPFGLVVIEAQALGAPVITVKEGGPEESIIEGITGIFCEAATDDVADKITNLLRNKALREKMSIDAKKNIKNNYNWRKSTQKFIEACTSYESKNL